MYESIKIVHSYWAYFTLLILILAILNAWVKIYLKRNFEDKDLRVSLFGLIVSHIQLLIGLVLWFMSPYFDSLVHGNAMGNGELRLLALEHPVTNILAVAAITIGWSRHKRQISSNSKFKSIAIFYLIGLLLLLSRIPYTQWLG